MHSSPSGQKPPHVGYGECGQSVGGGVQMQRVFGASGSGSHVPIEQSPSHSGGRVWSHGVSSGLQKQPCVDAPATQIEPGGQSPPHSGYGPC
jgi:hypothetical protein